MLPLWLRRPIDRVRLKDPAYAFLFDPGPEEETVSIDCETTGLDRRKDDIITVAAVKMRGARILTSERFEAVVRPAARMNPEAIKVHRLRERDVAAGLAMAEVLPKLLRFIGGRPLVGYYLEFDVAMIERYVKRWLGVRLPNPRIEISSLYYELKYSDAPPGTHVDLTFEAIRRDLDVPALNAHDAYQDALMTAMMYLTLKDRKARGVKIKRSGFANVNATHGG